MAVPGRGSLTAALWAALLAGAGAAGADEPAAGGWDASMAPYLWAARLDGGAKVADIEADVDVDIGSDFTWNAQTIVSHRARCLGHGLLFGVGHRALHWDHEDGDFA